MVADSVDYLELKSGVRTDGTAYATYGLATKIGNAIGAAAGVLILGAFGYVANAQQTPEAMRGINITVNLIPAILFLVAAACCLLWKMSVKDADDIRAQLAARRGEKKEEVAADAVVAAAAPASEVIAEKEVDLAGETADENNVIQ
jgi:Na+/melibiose symporter-like transporter